MKIQLQSLRVINCGPLRDVCIHFATDGDSPTTVLAGANGSGKTTVLELIAALAELLNPNPRDTSILEPLYRADYAQMDWLVNDDKLSICYGQSPPDAVVAVDQLRKPKRGTDVATVVSGDVLKLVRETIRQQQQTFMTSEDVLKLDDETFYRAIGTPYSGAPCLLFLPHSRFLLPLRGEKVQREELPYQWVHRYEPATSYEGSLDSLLIWLEYAEPEMFTRIVEFLNDLDFDGKTFGVRRKALKGTVTTRDGKQHYLEALSSGEQNILIMLMELRCRLLPHSIVLIDEIENSLHPAFQHRIVNGLKRLQEIIPFQLIVTSHSPTILEAFGTQSARILTQF